VCSEDYIVVAEKSNLARVNLTSAHRNTQALKMHYTKSPDHTGEQIVGAGILLLVLFSSPLNNLYSNCTLHNLTCHQRKGNSGR
jgi:hypothetical protein